MDCGRSKQRYACLMSEKRAALPAMKGTIWMATTAGYALAAGLATILAVGLAGCGDGSGAPGTPEELPEAFDFPPWLTMPEPNRIVVSWRTTEPSTGTVHFGTSPAYGASLSSVDEQRLHHLDLGTLEPATEYYYEVEIHGTDARRGGVFQTPGASTWRFLHIGELHAPSMVDYVAMSAEAIRAFQPHVIVESGDMLDHGDDLDHWRAYFQASAPWISNAILLPIGSNHVQGPDGNEHLRELFVLPNNEIWYATRWGNVQFLSLDSTYEVLDAQVMDAELAWLAEQTRLAHDGVEDPDFLVASWHYPACSSHYAQRAHTRDWIMDSFIGAFLQNGGLDLALVGHDKYYERSIIHGGIDGGMGGDIVHVQSNIGKLAPGDEGNSRGECEPIVTNTDTRSVSMFTVEPGRIRGRVLDEHGEEIDRFTITR